MSKMDGGVAGGGSIVNMECECGERLSFDRSEERVTCECGAMYAVMITQLTGPSQ